jgi:hypothetical protein
MSRIKGGTAAIEERPGRTLNWFRDRHAGASLLVCGCGESLNDLDDPGQLPTIGVNDVGRRFDPTYLVVLNRKTQFSGDRFDYVARSRARALFTQLDLPVEHPNVVRIRLGQRGGTDFADPRGLPYTQNSPYVALCLAAYMGTRRIGLIGVDFTDHHFFGATGRHPLARRLSAIDREYARLNAALRELGILVVNLSRCSRLTAFPKGKLEDLSRSGSDRRRSLEPTGLNIVSYATTPVAGVPAILARCIDAATPDACECVWASDSYGNGVGFAGGVQWRQAPGQAADRLARADLVIVHNGKVAPEHRAIVDRKPVLTLAHNYLWNVDQRYLRRGAPGVVVGQYQATLPEFASWRVVPNPVPLWEPAYRPEPRREPIGICYTPSGRHETYPHGHRLYWHAKGYESTLRVLGTLARRGPLRLEVIGARQLPHAEVLAMKRRSHIVIDECVIGSYHRNSLEGLAAGCVVVNGVGLLPGVAEALALCAGGERESPFVAASLTDLYEVLEHLVAAGAGELDRLGARNRAWMERHWDFAEQWRRLWLPAVEAALNAGATPGAGRRAATRHDAVAPEPLHPESRPPQRSDSAATAALDRGRAGIAVYWTCRGHGRGNFGDLLSPPIVQALARRPVTWRDTGARLFAVGSLLKFARAGDWVWGSGFIRAEDSCPLLELGHECPPVFGDPALLLPRFYRPQVEKRYRLGIIPHLVDADRLARLYGGSKGVLLIDVATTDIETTVHRLLSCEHSVSSALHGLVLSVAYGIPTRWLKCSDRIMGDDVKFFDFFAALQPRVAERLDPDRVALPEPDDGLEPYRPLRLGTDPTAVDTLVAATWHHALTLDLDRLLEACPIDGSGWR